MPRARPSSTPTPQAASDATGRREDGRAWREEVRERVRERRRDRGVEDELPLFREPREEPRPAPTRPQPEPALVESAEPLADVEIEPLEPVAEGGRAQRTFESPEPEEEMSDQGDWSLGPAESEALPRAVERPASGFERAQAAALDLALLIAVWGVVLYFAAKAARVSVTGLIAAWPALVGYLAGLSLLYAAYFTGITGHTPGKMIVGLRVVDTRGRAPGFVRALFRAVVGTLGAALALLALLPMLFDPARRALHDRIFRTRVVRA